MLISDAALPAAAHLVGPQSIDVLDAVVGAAGGVVESAKPSNVQYRPGHDATVRYTAQVSWHGAPAKRETLIAATTVHGTHPGAAVVTADTPAGRLDIGVWRWPFDPVLTGLETAVTAASVAPLVGASDHRDVTLDVIAFRPTDRAVVRVRHGDETSYLKVVAPGHADALAARHERLRAAGVPAPRVRRLDERGILVLDELAGTTFRDLIKSGSGIWPSTDPLDALADAFAAADLHATPVSAKITDGILHASMLATVMPADRRRLDELTDLLRRHETAPTATIHGDLHEAQIIVHDGGITGVLDIDDAGPGDPIDDRANLLAHLRYRAVTAPAIAPRLIRHADELRSASADRFELDRLDVVTAAALVGLATGPFRIQQPGWRSTVSVLLGEAEHIATGAGPNDPRTRRELSSGVHDALTDACPS